MSRDTDAIDTAAPNENEESFVFHGQKVRNGNRLQIPGNYFGKGNVVEKNDVVNVLVNTRESESDFPPAFWVFDAVVKTRGRFTIPGQKVDLYGVETGDVVDLEVFPTGLSAD